MKSPNSEVATVEVTYEISGAAGPVNNKVCHVANEVRCKAKVE